MKKTKQKLPRLRPIRNPGQRAGRNSLCTCGSGLKYKRCHGKPDTPVSYESPYQSLSIMYTGEQRVAELAFVKQWGFTPNPGQLEMHMAGQADDVLASILTGLDGIQAEAKWIYAVKKLRRLVTPKNQSLLTAEDLEEWDAALAEYTQAHEDEQCQITQTPCSPCLPLNSDSPSELPPKPPLS